MEVLYPGDKIDLISDNRKYTSTIVRGFESEFVAITEPQARGTVINSLHGKLVNIVFHRGDGIYSFLAACSGVDGANNDGLVRLNMRSPVSKYQRRVFERAEISGVCHVRTLRKAETAKDVKSLILGSLGVWRAEPDAWLEAVECETIDIGGGGISFRSDKMFEKGAVIELCMELDCGPGLTLDGVVVRIGKGSKEASGYVECAEFINIDERVRRRIIRHIIDPLGLRCQAG